MSIENSIDRLAAAIEKLASAVSAPVVVGAVSGGIEPVRLDPAADQSEPAGGFSGPANAAEPAKKPRGRPRKVADLVTVDPAAATASPPSSPPANTVAIEVAATGPSPAAQTAVTATAGVTAAAAATGNTQTSVTAHSTTVPTTSETTTGSVETISKDEIVKILTGLQKTLEEKATSIDEKRAAAQKCRNIIKSVVGSESLKEAKPHHFAQIKSAVLKVLNNE